MVSVLFLILTRDALAQIAFLFLIIFFLYHIISYCGNKWLLLLTLANVGTSSVEHEIRQ